MSMNYHMGQGTADAYNQIFTDDSRDIFKANYLASFDEEKIFVSKVFEAAKKAGYTGTINSGDAEEDAAELIKFLKSCLKKQGISLERGNLENWINRGMGVKKVKNGLKYGLPETDKGGRIKLFKLCFALNMNAEEAGEFFLKACFERSYNYRDWKEVIFRFCLQEPERTYKDAERLIAWVEENKETFPDSEMIYITEDIGERIKHIQTEQKLKYFLQTNWSSFNEAGYNRTAQKKVANFLKQCMELYQVNSIERVVNQLYDIPLREVAELHKRRLADSKLPKLLLRHFPTYEEILKVYNRKENQYVSNDSIRKVLIVLYFFVFFSKEEYNKIDGFDEFELTMNLILNQCGFMHLYWKNPFDWLIGYCAMAEEPIEKFQAYMKVFFLDENDIDIDALL